MKPLQYSHKSGRRALVAGAVLMAVATAIGALGAHQIKDILPADRYAVLQTAVLYQFLHALGLIGVGLLLERHSARSLVLGARLLLAGVLLFSGSLYALLLGAPRVIGVLTPLGGLCLIAGWCAVAFALLRAPDQAPP